jgi:HK97 family phage portal protein
MASTQARKPAGFLARLVRRLAPERRALPAFGYGPFYPLSGRRVDSHTAENLAPVLACVSAIGSGLASLPAYVYRREAAGRTEDPAHPVAALLRQPNPHLTWPDWLEWTVAQVLLQGNALSVLETDGAGRPVALWPVPWQHVSPLLLPSGTLAFEVTAYPAPWGGPTITRQRFLASECFHLKDRSDDGLIGRSRLSRAWEPLANAAALQQWSGAVWENGATPSGVLEVPNKISPDGLRRLESEFQTRRAGAANGGRPIFLDAGAKWTSISVSPEAAQVLESRRFTVEEIARLFGVPPPIVQDYTHNTFTNSAAAALWFAQFSLTPWARKIEAEASRSLFSAEDRATHELVIDLSGLTRGDYATRWQSYAIAIANGILTPDEVRQEEGWNARGAPGPAAAAAGAA